MKATAWLITLAFTLASGFGQAQQLIGFSDTAATRQLDWEKQFDAQLRASDLDGWMKVLTAHPHPIGSPGGKANAEYLAGLFRQWGYQTEIASYEVLFPTPRVRELTLLGSKPYKAKLEEPALREDRTSGERAEQLPPYNAYSADGDVTAELIFVNRGVPADYEELARLGIDVKGKIVIAKYGGSWRGIKPKVAAEHGAVGCLIYSDPADDGYAQGDTYPVGPFRPAFGAQRGSVMDMPVYPGDPLTPDVGATHDAKRLSLREATTIMKIPVLPISYEDALPLLQALGGQVVPASWRGALPITYHVGPSRDKVHLKLAFNWDLKPLYNVIARMPGSRWPDQWVIRGNHHDGWVNGAEDPVSGLVSELEEAKAIGELVRKGFRPLRTLVYCAWDGEEPALLGSTEWTEDHQAELSQKAVVYVNTDGNDRGFIGAGGSHTLEPFFNQVIASVQDPETGVSVRDRHYAKVLADADYAGREKNWGHRDFRLEALGAGSDWSGFLQHLGIASLDVGYGGEGRGGQYHSTYDSYDYFTRFIDPGFQYGITLSKTTGRLILRLADAEVLPMDFSSFYRTVNDYATEVHTLLDDTRRQTAMNNQVIRDSLYDLAKDPTRVSLTPAPKEPVPYLNFSGLQNALADLERSAAEFTRLYPRAINLPADRLDQFNTLLYKAERSLLYAPGLPRRSWYRHEIYAPGYYTGYGVKTLPGIREAIEQRNWKEAQEQIDIVTATLQAYAGQVKRAYLMLK
ncbi:MAG TPA: transferrin receptor-like dimerization domain-containing protein [Chitinophagaceae bacterium]|nr:transferrin receptor-like dimerization domain-containing protein [Chitinophagaceae bacterium]